MASFDFNIQIKKLNSDDFLVASVFIVFFLLKGTVNVISGDNAWKDSN